MTPEETFQKEAEELYPHATVGTPEEIQWANSFQDARRLVHIDARRKSAAELSELREQLAAMQNHFIETQTAAGKKFLEQAEEYRNKTNALREQLKALQEETRWISVEERLPGTERGAAEQFVVNSYVKGADNENIQICAAWYDGKFYNLEYWQIYENHEIAAIELKTITHWRPLPQPPKNN